MKRSLSVLALVAALACAGCSGGSSTSSAPVPTPTPTPNSLSLFDAGQVVQNWSVYDTSTGDGRLYFYLHPDDDSTHQLTLSGTYVLEPVEGSGTPSGAGHFTVTLYSGGKAVRTWDALSTQTGDYGRLYLRLPGLDDLDHEITIAGTYTVVPHD